jgi:hypothetical protein
VENARILASTPDVALEQTARALRPAAERFLTAVAEADGAPRPWIVDVQQTPGGLLSSIAADLAVHRWDLARARRSPRQADAVLDAAAHLVIDAALRVAPAFLTAAADDVRITYELRIRGGGTYRLAFDHGTLAVEAGPAPDADCRLSAAPSAFVLVGYGRQPVASAILRGSLMAFGRKPWLGLRFPTLIRNP